MAVNSTEEGCDSDSVVSFPTEPTAVTQCEFAVDISNSMDLSPDDEMNSQTYISTTVENVAAYTECVEKDEDIETGKSETLRVNEETFGDVKIDEGQMKSLQKQISFEMGGKYMQLLMNHSFVLPKFSTQDKTAADKVVEGPRMRKYKRTASFNSRKVAFLFSILSCLGTIILIYLTLRVKQIGDASSVHSE